MPQSPSPSNRLSFHWNSIKLTNIRRPWGEGSEDGGGAAGQDIAQLTGAPGTHPRCHLPHASIRQIHQCRREREQIFNYAINCDGLGRRRLFFASIGFLFFLCVSCISYCCCLFGFLVYMHFVSLLLLRCSAVSFCNEIYVRCAKSNGQSVVLTFIHTFICIYACTRVCMWGHA